MRYIVCNSDNVIVSVCDTDEPPVFAGHSAYGWTGEGDPIGLVRANDGTVFAPAPGLDAVRADRWSAARAYRDARQTGGCDTPLGRVDTDADSQRKIAGAALAASIAKASGAEIAVDWTMSDNSVVTHDAPAMMAMGMAVVAFLNDCQRAGTAVRGLLEAATTVAELWAVDIKAGYPAAAG